MGEPDFSNYSDCQQIIEAYGRAHGMYINPHALPIEAQQLFAMLIYQNQTLSARLLGA